MAQQQQIVTKGMSLRAIKADFERLHSSHSKLRARADIARKATNQTEALFMLGNDPSGTLPAQVRNGDPLAKYRLLSPDKIRRTHREASTKLGGAALAEIATRLTTANGTRPPPTSDVINDMGTKVLEAKAQLSLHRCQMYGASKRQRAKALADQKAIQARHREACAKRNAELATFADQYDHNQANYHIVFQKFDEDGSGTIDAGEMARALAHMGLKLPKATIALLMRKYDADGSGEIDFDELKEAFLTASQGGELAEARMKELDFNGDNDISLPEFIYGISSWVGMDDDVEEHVDEEEELALDLADSNTQKNG